MRKNIKWILLAILIIMIIITGILFINFATNKEDSNNISKIYNIEWFRKEAKLYINNELYYEGKNLIDQRYLKFEKDKVHYCNYDDNNKCETYNYTYNEEEETIFFDSGENFVKKGTYKVVFYKDGFELTLKDKDDSIIIYTFRQAKG